MGTHRPEVLAGVEDRDLHGTTVLVTGSTSGLGRETALALGRLGATILVHGRDRQRGSETVAEIEDAGGTADLFVADFASLDNVRDLARELRDAYSLDILVNNAGGYFSEGRLTEDGIEYTFQVNHLAPFYLTGLLFPEFRESKEARIVNVSSEAHRATRSLNLDRLEQADSYSAWRAYSRSKMANILFTYELADRVDLPVNCLHPGFVPGSRFYRNFPFYFRAFINLVAALPDPVAHLTSTSVAEGASTILYLAVAADRQETGGYYIDREEHRSSSVSYREGLQRELWDWSIDHTPLEQDDMPQR
ncbi:MAG: SDR family oxidoreductase [Candidatus Nanohaloarchaea archaeon]|nr:SDR family oxidoreductase [Candidatus Nanohaloarchaea archaeon]